MKPANQGVEHLLRCLVDDEENEVRVHWRALSIILSLDEVADAVFDEPELLLEQPMTPNYSVEIVKLCEDRLAGFVDCLFDLSVTIGTLHQLGLAALQNGPKAAKAIKSSMVNDIKSKPELTTTSTTATRFSDLNQEMHRISLASNVPKKTAAISPLSRQALQRGSIVFQDNFTVHTLTHNWSCTSKSTPYQTQRIKESEQTTVFTDSFKTQTPPVTLPADPP